MKNMIVLASLLVATAANAQSTNETDCSFVDSAGNKLNYSFSMSSAASGPHNRGVLTELSFTRNGLFAPHNDDYPPYWGFQLMVNNMTVLDSQNDRGWFIIVSAGSDRVFPALLTHGDVKATGVCVVGGQGS
jgi:hypothetical protein